MSVINGGKLIQNVQNHALHETHMIFEPKTQRIYDITSTHHQMQYPFNLDKKDYTILMYSYKHYSDIYEGDGIDTDLIEREPEVVLYHGYDKPKCLAIQGHPEYMRKDAPIVIRLNEIINDLV